MSVTSPTSASPGQSLLHWDEAAVHSYLAHLGLGQYEDMVYEHGITGDVLCVMDHDALIDLGIGSIGHRLNVLRAVWELKREQGITQGDDDWKPQETEVEQQKAQAANVDRLWDLIIEQQERLVKLERDHARLVSALDDTGLHVPVPNSADTMTMKDSRWRDFGTKTASEDEAGSSRMNRRASQLFPSSLASSTTTMNPPLSATSDTFQDSFTPTSTSTAQPIDSPQYPAPAIQSRSRPPITRLMSEPSQSTITAQSASVPSLQPPVSTSRTTPPTNGKTDPRGASPVPPAPSTSTTTALDSEEPVNAEEAAHRAAKSFRVTLEDPCYKVLPAALKKYKIVDDPHQYALFICFGSTERCLSLDEKPLMLFQRLKETGQKPVFMLRHLRDIKSPVAVAQQKQAMKLGLPPNTTEDVLPRIKPASETSASPIKDSSLQPTRRREDGQTPAGGVFPELPSPGLTSGDSGPRSARMLTDKDGNSQIVSYAVSIYPYCADRQDEFNVPLGATYVITNRAKGWYIVQRDPHGTGNIVLDPSKSGWVPAGCLLELAAPVALVSPAMDHVYPGLSPIPPSNVVSSSYPGVVLMGWEAKGEDQVTLNKGENVKVYKKYTHC